MDAAPRHDHRGPVTGASFAPDGRRVVSGGEDGGADLGHRDGLGEDASVPPGTSVAEFSPDGEQAISAG